MILYLLTFQNNFFKLLGPLVCRSFSNPSESFLAGIVSHGEGEMTFSTFIFKLC